MRADELEQGWVHGRPDRARVGLVAGVHLDPVLHDRLREVEPRAKLAQVLDRDHDLEVELLALTGVHEGDLAAGADDPAPDLRERPLRRREADPLERPVRHPREPLEGQREVRAALRPRHRVHLVEDHGLDAAQHLPPLRGEEQVERLGSRDEDIGRLPQHPLAVALGGVARAHTDDELRPETGQRPAEIPLDVVVQGLQRRDVEEPQPLPRPVVQPVDPLEERGERLARAGRRLDEHVRPGRDRGPGELLCRRRAVEGPLEPGSRRG